MPKLPTGTVTFLFTDLEASTQLAGRLGDRFTPLLARHHELIRGAFAAQDGVELATEGDAFFAVFPSASAALNAAIEVQRSLQAESWPEGAEVSVRIGLHTGEAVLGADNYVGLDVHRASRIRSAGHGGQILMSDTTRALVERALPDGAELRDLGKHRLKGLPAAERIFQVVVPGLPSVFPALASLEARPNNLPLEVTSFIGRERQIREIAERLLATRLLTLTGPGGTGKTRLALRVAEELLPEFDDGAWFVALDAVRDPGLVPSAIATALDLHVVGDQPMVDAVESWVTDHEALLVLDNFEQVAAAAPIVSRLLAAAPRLRILATSRTPLRLYGEQQYPVPPLAGGSATTATVDTVSQYEAVRLFIERALAVKPDFRVTNENAPAVAQITARLDGLPLAIELAAARIKLLTPEEMLARLERSMSLLSSSAQDLPERQRTLRGAIEWSHEMLSPTERVLFARLSIFRGSFSLEAAELVCGEGLEGDALDGVASLIDKSLLRSAESDRETRFRMLETIREYARERLTDAGAYAGLARRHAEHYFSLAGEAEPHLTGADQLAWLSRLEREHDNLRAAFERQGEIGMLDDARRAAAAIWRFWQLRGHVAEARATFDRLLLDEGGTPIARAKALIGAGGIAYWQGDFEAMARFYEEAREIYETAGDIGGLAEALYNASFTPLLLRGDVEGSRATLARALELYRQAGNVLGAAEAESMLGWSHFFAGNPEAAIPYQADAIEVMRASGSTWHVADNLIGLAALHAQTGDWERAIDAIHESLELASDAGLELVVEMAFEIVAAIAAWVGDAERAARLIGKADEIKKRLRAGAPTQFMQLDPLHARAREQLGAQRFGVLRDEGMRLRHEEARELAESFRPPPDTPPLPKSGMGVPTSATEPADGDS